MHVPDRYRVVRGDFASTREADGDNGAFFIPNRGFDRRRVPLKVIASDGSGASSWNEAWQHVSVSLPHRCPTWEEMCRVKEMFWDAEDVVVQLHVPRSQWVNNHPYCLHLWRAPAGMQIPLPPQWMVGNPELGTLKAKEV